MTRWQRRLRFLALAQFAAVGLAAGWTVACLPCGDATGPQCLSPDQGHTPRPRQVTYYRTDVSDGTTGPLDVYAYGGGSCEKSTEYRDPGSAYSIKCQIPAVSAGAAALQAWFGHGKLASWPRDPSLDHDVFQQVRFVLAPGAAASIGGTSCTSDNSTSQLKVHKSVYGQAGGAWNGWVMSNVAPCSDGDVGPFSEPEMWGINGARYLWPQKLREASVYHVVYRDHRYTARGCGTVAVRVNRTKGLDSPCWGYMGTTNGSTQGL